MMNFNDLQLLNVSNLGERKLVYVTKSVEIARYADVALTETLKIELVLLNAALKVSRSFHRFFFWQKLSFHVEAHCRFGTKTFSMPPHFSRLSTCKFMARIHVSCLVICKMVLSRLIYEGNWHRNKISDVCFREHKLTYNIQHKSSTDVKLIPTKKPFKFYEEHENMRINNSGCESHVTPW